MAESNDDSKLTDKPLRLTFGAAPLYPLDNCDPSKALKEAEEGLEE
ncbi:hypothetical protein KGY71_03300 [Candidatus Bipolaricaulota bacterium]|nr:hypothetical protein [Candidatus Bipolaricaulota bacterium]